MKRLVEFPIDNNESIFVEVEVEDSQEDLVPVSRGGDLAIKASQSLEEALDHVRPAASAIIGKIRTIADTPDEIEVQFGLKLTAAAGAIIAAAGVEANYTVKLKWTNGK